MLQKSPQHGNMSTRTLAGIDGLFLGIAVCGIGMMIAVVTIGPSTATYLTEEDGPVENLTMFFFATAAVLCAIFAFRARGSLRFYLGLWAVLGLLFCGEEVSWGQRWFDYETPELLLSNYQGEANIHNLPWLTPRVVENPTDLITSQGLFYAGFFTYFLVIPLGMWLLMPFRRLVQRLGFPPISAALFAAIWLPIVASFALAMLMAFGPSREALTETRELHFALSILLYSLLLVSYAGPAFRFSRPLRLWFARANRQKSVNSATRT